MPLWIGLPMVLTSENNLAPNCSNAAFGSKDMHACLWMGGELWFEADKLVHEMEIVECFYESEKSYIGK